MLPLHTQLANVKSLEFGSFVNKRMVTSTYQKLTLNIKLESPERREYTSSSIAVKAGNQGFDSWGSFVPKIGTREGKYKKDFRAPKHL